jgi:hypothetical protein
MCRQGVGLGDAAAGAADDDGDLALVVDLVRLRRHDNGLVMADLRTGHPQEQRGFPRGGAVGLAAMCFIVQAHAQDLAGVRNDW